MFSELTVWDPAAILVSKSHFNPLTGRNNRKLKCSGILNVQALGAHRAGVVLRNPIKAAAVWVRLCGKQWGSRGCALGTSALQHPVMETVSRFHFAVWGRQKTLFWRRKQAWHLVSVLGETAVFNGTTATSGSRLYLEYLQRWGRQVSIASVGKCSWCTHADKIKYLQFFWKYRRVVEIWILKMANQTRLAWQALPVLQEMQSWFMCSQKSERRSGKKKWKLQCNKELFWSLFTSSE